ncbi:DUF368 domain-containing protein [Membranihabitans marinus]
MGMAEVVPGVSGGTIAFISGIYERLINAIKAVDGQALQYLLRGKWKSFFQKIDGVFLLFLLLGMIGGLLVGIFLISHLIEVYPIPMWAFFFGLILGSAIYIALKIKDWNLKSILLLIGGFGFAYFITRGMPMSGIDSPWAYFLAGTVAISALILPGISGSFILLILGMYTLVLHNVKSILTSMDIQALIKIAAFGVGILIGLALFSRVLSWTFKNYKYPTYALLTGFIFGSLNKIWPWKIPTMGLDKEGQFIAIQPGQVMDWEEIKIVAEQNVGPYHSAIQESHLATVIVLVVLGLAIIYGIAKVEKKAD